MLEKQVAKLLEEGWKWMTPSDLYLCCCGMSFPGPDQPFWKMPLGMITDDTPKECRSFQLHA
jgi:hypothetical protein